MCYCCENCFLNSHIKDFIRRKNLVGDCDYCRTKNARVISIEDMGVYFRECLDKAYEPLEAGTGAYLDPEDKDFHGPTGESATRFSVIEIFQDENVIDDISDTSLIEEIMKASGPSIRDIQNGEVDPYGDIFDECYVLRNDLFGVYDIGAYYTWERFKFTVKHYNRFFDVDNCGSRKQLLDALYHFIEEYVSIIPAGAVFYRAREAWDSLDFETLTINKELSPAPPKYAQANRMSPAGISYLYLASSAKTACAECRYSNTNVVLAKYCTKSELQIVDFSITANLPTSSIFSEDYDHDSNWFNHFLRLFSKEISVPVDGASNRSYEYAATQLLAEYIRSKDYDGIAFNSSVSKGKSYCFFCGPDLRYSKKDYGILDNIDQYQTLPSFLDSFSIPSISMAHVAQSGEVVPLGKMRVNEDDTDLQDEDDF